MSLLIFSIILFIIAAVVSISIIYWMRTYKNSRCSYLVALVSLGAFLILLFGSFTSIPANSVGIIYDDMKGGIQEKTYGEGYHSKSVFEHITTISTANRSARVNTTGQTNDGQYATFELSIIYKIKTQDAGKFYKITNDSDIPTSALNTIIKSTLQSSTIKYDIFELLSTELENARIEFKNALAESLYQNYYITLVDVAFDDIDGGEEVEAILEASAKAQQEIDIAKLTAEANLITKENEAEIKKLLADAEAYAIKAEGEAKGQAASAYVTNIKGMIDSLYENSGQTLTYEQCSDLVLSIVFYDTWDGVLPEVLTSDSLSSMIGSLITGDTTTEDTTKQ